jgi:hypothetical protein
VNTQPLRLALVNLTDNRATLSNYELMELLSVVETTRHFLRKEREERDARFVDECLEIQGAPV